MKKPLIFLSLKVCFLYLGMLSLEAKAHPAENDSTNDPPTKIRDIVIYQDSMFYAAFPSVVKKENGEYIVAFRRAPERKMFGEKGSNHVDPNSFLVKVTSTDGINWSNSPELIYAHAFGGSQDPCLLQLKDGTLLCSSYGWAFVRPDGLPNLKSPYFNTGNNAVFLGGYVLKSTDGGKNWEGPYYPPNIEPEVNYSALGNPIPAYNRGAMYEGRDGSIFWVVAASDSSEPKKTSNHLLISTDKGETWEYSAPVAVDEKISFNEASIYETPKGDLVSFIRTANFEDQAVIARSTDGGKSFNWESMGFQGHPLQALQLPDSRVLVVYGYRHQPYGIRARVLNAECTDFATAPEIILRDDGGNTDIGYPWAVMMDDEHVLVTYYFNIENGNRHIAGTILKIN